MASQTSLQHARSPLPEQEERYRRAQRISGIAIWEWDVQQDRAYWDPNSAEVYGRSFVGFGHAQWLEAIHPEDRQRVVEELQAALASGCNYQSEYRIITPAGDERWLLGRGEVERDQLGTALRMRGVNIDITDRKLREIDLQRRDEIFRSVYTQAVTGICVTELDGRFLQANPSFCRMTGYSEKELLESTVLAVTHPADRPANSKLMKEIASGERTQYIVNKRYVRKDGEELWARTLVSLLTTDPSRSRLIAVVEDVTQQRATELALRQSEERRLMAVDAAAVGTWYWDLLSGQFIWDSECRRLLGVPEEGYSPTYSGFLNLVHEDDRADVDRAVIEAMRSNTPYESEYRIVLPDGVIRWIHGKGTSHREASGRLLRMQGTVSDITKLKSVEAALRASEQKYRLTFEKTSVGVAHVAQDGTWLQLNDRFCELLGYSQPELAKLTFQQLTHPDDLQADLDQLAQLIAGDIQRYSLEKRYLRKSGEIIWVLLTVSALRDERGKLLHFISVVQDITQRKQAQEALREGRERLQAALVASGTGTFRWDIRSNALDWDENLDRLFGLPPNVTARSLNQFLVLVHPEDRNGVLERCERCAKEGADFEMEFRVIWPDGSIHWLYDRGKTQFGTDGRPAYMAGACVDITGRKSIEDALRKSEKLAAVGRMAASISHEINNPLEAVTNLLYLIGCDQELSQSTRGFLNEAQSQLARVGHIATQTLRFYRQSTRPSQANVADLVDSIATLYRGRMFNASVKLEYRGDRSVQLFCFADEMKQVLANVIGNAIDASHKGKILVRATAGKNWRTGESGVRIVVADNGHGMSRDTLRHIFEPFFSTKGITGTGLGLWVTSEIIQKHAGTVLVKSSDHPHRHGTVFSMFFPAHNPKLQAAI